MKKLTLIFLTFIILTLSACGSTSNRNNPVSVNQNGSSNGSLPAATQLALGTLKLEGTDNAVTAEQAAELLPLWQTMQVLYSSDTAANQEIEALSTQIRETMTAKQMQAITAMNLNRQDMFSIMQAQGVEVGNGQQNNNSQQSGNSSSNRGFAPGGFVPGGGGPPDGGSFPGGAGFGSSGQSQNRSANQIATAQASRQAGGGNQIPSPLINALIEFLKQKAGS